MPLYIVYIVFSNEHRDLMLPTTSYYTHKSTSTSSTVCIWHIKLDRQLYRDRQSYKSWFQIAYCSVIFMVLVFLHPNFSWSNCRCCWAYKNRSIMQKDGAITQIFAAAFSAFNCRAPSPAVGAATPLHQKTVGQVPRPIKGTYTNKKSNPSR